jgi:diguanylate cyclase (GGDEF)-like protein
MPAVNEAEARTSAERIRMRISESVIAGLDTTRQQVVTVSIGVAVLYPAMSDSTPAALIAAADEALLSAKRGGRDRVIMSDGA